MANQLFTRLRAIWVLMRVLAVVSSSVATILSGLLPLYLMDHISINRFILLFLFLVIAAFVIHGVLTHAFNDYTDYLSGTDANSPAILSGGSRVIQKGMIPFHTLKKLSLWLVIILLATAVFLIFIGQYKLTFLLVIGVWAAVSYSLPPFYLSYRPFLGEWFSLFPAMLFLGLSGPWLILDSIPLWALQNAVINALFCMAWVLVHHIPDLEADRQAKPMKQTSVVWFANKFGLYFARIPAIIYLLLIGLCIFWLSLDRIWAAGLLIVTVAIALFIVLKMDIANPVQVTTYEKILLLLAMITAIGLGIFV